MNYPIEAVRKRFPALQRTYKGKPVVYLDGPGGSQTVVEAINAGRDYMMRGGANLHGAFPTSKETMEKIAEAKEYVAALFNGKAEEVAFGPNATTMMFHAARAVAKTWKEGDEILLTELEHHANIDPWRKEAEDKNVTVKYIPLDTKTLTLDLSSLDQLLTEKTKFVAIGLASNCIGTINDVKTVSKAAKKAGAVVAVDAVHGIPHFYVDREALGVDMLFSSVYKMFGPHVGLAMIKKDLFDQLDPYKIMPAPDYAPDKLEIGTQNHEGIMGVTEAVAFIADLGEGNTLKERIISGYEAIEQYEEELVQFVRGELESIKGLTLYQAPDSVKKTPTVAFRVEGMTPREFTSRMCEEASVFIADGHFYAYRLAEKLGIVESGSFIRAGISVYNTMEEMKRFVDGIKAIVNNK
ncbi:cysteine desulfurase-like protein [Isachenkonia alkalipeptolytica]|uniref:Cysteine desulfurase-like protein n=1 Tax=Isachenkonia alkalipeptolytica TaxID=2565777 RepID=A0AA44BE47_9CLOT|nr:cysteine desulfurase-like protein [Isachenkonia alkalipeptolytica]NBG87750.1 cysteine desulfurase-like protein [Isachenkonia alkalipeptolytica]